MENIMHTKLTACALVTTLAITGCANMNDTQKKTATGAGAGAVAGAVLGAVTGPGGWGRAAVGAAIGGLVGGGAGYLWGNHMEKQKQEMQTATQGTGVEVVQTQDNRIKVSIPSDISFATNSATLSPQFKTILRDLATTLKNNPSTSITMIGYTDNTGTDAINIPLSRQRAESVMNYLVSQGVSSSRFTVEGKGSSDPIASNDTAAGRAQNRRVEIYVGERAK